MTREQPTTHSFPVFRALGEPKKNWIERLLAVFADVRAGEGTTVLLLFANGFLLMSAYYLLKISRDTLILTHRGAAVKAYLAGVQAILLLGVIPLYGKLASRVNRVRLITWVTLLFTAFVPVFYLGATLRKVDISMPFYVWIGIMNMLLVAQFWGFANDLYSEAQGKRLFPVVGTGVAIGGIAGAAWARNLFDGRKLDVYGILLLGGGVLAASVVVTRVIHARESARSPEARRTEAEAPLGKQGGFQLVRSDRYLALIAVMVVLLNLVNATGGYIWDNFIQAEAVRLYGDAPDAAQARLNFTGGVLASFSFWQNTLVFVIQAFLVSRVFLFAGVRGALFFLPCLALGAYSLIAALPILGLVRIAKLGENATDYSLSNTTRAALFLPTAREAKYKAKAAIDSFFSRIGDVLYALVVFVGFRMLHLPPAGFALINIAVIGIWLFVAVQIAREHKRRSEPGLKAAAASA